MKQRVNILELNCLNIALKGRYNEQDGNTKVQVYYRPQGSVFTRVCHSVHSWGMRGRGRGHAWQGGMCGRRVHGRGVCMAGGMHGREGMHGRGMHGRGRRCAWRGRGHAWQVGHAWQGGVCGGGRMVWGMHGRGMCVAGGMHGRGGGVCGRRDGHCSGCYASYWNAFLFCICELFIAVWAPSHTLVFVCDTNWNLFLQKWN